VLRAPAIPAWGPYLFVKTSFLEKYLQKLRPESPRRLTPGYQRRSLLRAHCLSLSGPLSQAPVLARPQLPTGPSRQGRLRLPHAAGKACQSAIFRRPSWYMRLKPGGIREMRWHKEAVPRACLTFGHSAFDPGPQETPRFSPGFRRQSPPIQSRSAARGPLLRVPNHRSKADCVRLFTRNGYNVADRFPMIVALSRACPSGPASSTARRSSSTTMGYRSSTCCAAGNTMAPPSCAR
jgi:hypothetical protein